MKEEPRQQNITSALGILSFKSLVRYFIASLDLFEIKREKANANVLISKRILTYFWDNKKSFHSRLK